MSKRLQDIQGAGPRHTPQEPGPMDPSNVPQKATAAQMARRQIAQAKGKSRSNRSSRANTPTAPSFGAQQDQGQGQGQNVSFAPAQSDFTFSNGGGAPVFGVQSAANGTSTTPPPSNPFAAAAPQQNGGSGVFGSGSTSFGSGFGGTNASQPQQNGLATSSNMFGAAQNGDKPSFGSFGQNQSQQNGLTPSTNNSFPSFAAQSQQNGTAPMFGAAQPSSTTPKTTGDVFKSFGQSNTSETPKPTGDLFKSFGQQAQNGAKPSEAPTTGNMFGKPNGGTGTGLFGSMPQPPPPQPNLGTSLFSGMNQSKSDEIKPGMFSQTKDDASKTNGETPFKFGLTNGGSSLTAGAQTSKPGNLFGGFGQAQANGEKSGLFGAPVSQASQTPAAGGSSLFQSKPEQPTPQQNSFPSFSFGQSHQAEQSHQAGDMSMTTPETTPKKPISFAPTSSATPMFSATPATAGAGAATPFGASSATDTNSSFKPSTSFFTQPSQTTPAKPENTAPAESGKSLFDRITRPSDAASSATPSSLASQLPPQKSTETPSATPAFLHHSTATPNIAQPPPETLSSARGVASTKSSMNDTIPESEGDTFLVLNEGLKAHLETQDPRVDWSTICEYYLVTAAKIRNKSGPKIDNLVPKTSGANNVGAGLSSASSNVGAGSFNPELSSQATTAQTSPSKNVFGSIGSSNVFGETPRKASNQQTPSEAPQTAPVNSKKRRADEDADQVPATEKRTRSDAVQYPKLPENASKSAKLFQAVLDKPAGTSSPSMPSAASAFGRAGSETERAQSPRFGPPPAMLEQAREDKEKAQVAAASSFKASTSEFTPAPTGFAPSVSSSGPPQFAGPSAGPGGFLAAFGKKADQQEAKDKKKRKAEEYDSDEDNEAEWEAKDKEAQEAKKKKLLEAGAGAKGFTFSSTAPKTDCKTTPAVSQTPAATGTSLFDLNTPRDPPATVPAKENLFDFSQGGTGKSTASSTSPIKAAGTTTSTGQAPFSGFAFSSLGKGAAPSSKEADKAEPEKQLGTGDNTWKPDVTPIKFGGASAIAESTTPATAPPKNHFSNLFGGANDKLSASTSAPGHLSVPGAKPALGFQFGGALTPLENSRATTPAVTTDGEGTSTAGEGDAEAGGEDAAPAEAQVEDQTDLRAEEMEHEDLVCSVAMAKGMKYENKKDADSNEMKLGWVEKGKGPLFVLKHKESGKIRVVLKVPPFGKAAMNFTPLPAGDYATPNAKSVKGPFVDHINPQQADKGKPSTWLIMVGKPEDAKEICRLLTDGKTK